MKEPYVNKNYMQNDSPSSSRIQRKGSTQPPYVTHKCFRYHVFKHIASNCLNRRIVTFTEGTEDEEKEEGTQEEENTPPPKLVIVANEGKLLVLR